MHCIGIGEKICGGNTFTHNAFPNSNTSICGPLASHSQKRITVEILSSVAQYVGGGLPCKLQHGKAQTKVPETLLPLSFSPQHRFTIPIHYN